MKGFVLAAALTSCQALNNGLGFTPGLGWNSDYCQNCQGAIADENGIIRGFQNEGFFKHIADFLNSSGMQALGYKYVNSDAGWDTMKRDSDGNLVPDPSLWPSGFAWTVNYIHSLGLGIGLYGDRGTMDCSARPGNLGYEVQDANLYANLDIDWYKSDSCYASQDQNIAFGEYGNMTAALNATGKHIWFALCGWNTWYSTRGKDLANSWRIGEDTGSGWAAVMSNVEGALSLANTTYAGPTEAGGGWMDMCLLLLPGMGSDANLMSQERHRAQFSMHCIFQANMLTTGNLSSIDPYALQTWTNAEAVAINQDPAGNPFIILQPDNATSALAQRAAKNSVQRGFHTPEEVRNWAPAPVAASDPPAMVAECGGEPTLQNWVFNSPAQSYLFNNASNYCLNVFNCETPIIFDGCRTTGGTCAGPDKYSNEQWQLNADGSLTSMLPGNKCATVAADRTISLVDCTSPLASNQNWTYSSVTGELQQNGLCLTAAGAPPPPSSEIVLVGRELHDGSWAVLALNNEPTNQTVVCGAACFAAMGFAPSQTVVVRDLWQHADVATIPASSYPIPVGANGSTTLLKITASN
jgi:hypothetical protein